MLKWIEIEGVGFPHPRVDGIGEGKARGFRRNIPRPRLERGVPNELDIEAVGGKNLVASGVYSLVLWIMQVVKLPCGQRSSRERFSLDFDAFLPGCGQNCEQHSAVAEGPMRYSSGAIR
jgi:hypothetical protein